MKTAYKIIQQGVAQTLFICLAFGQFAQTAQAASVDLANVPLVVKNSVTPNVLVIYDNSQSMDAFMNGTLVSGNNPSTRGNIGRSVMRNAINTYRSAFNWGLMTYDMTGGAPGLYNTYAYYLGSDAGMVFTDDCVGFIPGNPPTVGVSASNGNRRCIANPQPFLGGNFVTYDKTGDDADIQDVFYTGGVYTGLWGLSPGAGTSYHIYLQHQVASGNSWADPGAFTSSQGTWSFTPTDAGYLSNNPPMTRQVYTPRGWGYNQNITGKGNLDEQVAVDSTTHYNTLQSKLANETNAATGEIKNGALFTPLRGTLQSGKTYFSTSLSGKTSPVQYSCQQNFVMLVTDGLPTGDTSGNLYSAAARANNCTWSTATNSCTSGSFGTAATDAISAVNALRTTTVSGYTSANKDGTGAVTGNYDVQTYVVALGDTVANAYAISVMNAMAYAGGTGSALLANDAISFQNAISSITDSITAKVGSSATAATSTLNPVVGNNLAYVASYTTVKWTGNLEARSIDVSTGVVSEAATWCAENVAMPAACTGTMAAKVSTIIDTRNIKMNNGTSLVDFTYANLSAAQKTNFNSAFLGANLSQWSDLTSAQQTAAAGTNLVNFLRGQNGYEDRASNVAANRLYRLREAVLGDAVESTPAYIAKPTFSYTDQGYSAFKTAQAGRAGTVYMGTNDGMLHAFDGSNGNERWAYVPSMVIPNMWKLADKNYSTMHTNYVNGNPIISDICSANCSNAATAVWKTILVGGLNGGGRGYYALDITIPTAPVLLWEFDTTSDNDLGYTFGDPIITKKADGTWVALITSGYNNTSSGNGRGYLYVLNANTGSVISKIGTGVGTTATPSGLARIAAYADNAEKNNTATYTYGGDLLGNLWRFDINAAAVPGTNPLLFATLKDSGGNPQPITTAPELGIINKKRVVFVGTGKYLEISDLTDTQQQTLYAIKDDNATTTLVNPRTTLVAQTLTTVGANRTATTNLVDFTTGRGWYVNFPDSGERQNVAGQLVLGTLLIPTTVPSNTLCSPGGYGWLNYFNYQTGGRVLPGSSIVSSKTNAPIVGVNVFYIGGVPKVSIVTSDQPTPNQVTDPKFKTGLGGFQNKKVIWRELIQ